jgi:hypothetical protein
MSIFGEIRAGAVGSLVGMVAYLAWLVSRPSRLGEPESWHIEGPIKWFVLAGFLVGALGGLSLVERWLDYERDDIENSTWFNAVFVIALLVMAALLFFSLNG